MYVSTRGLVIRSVPYRDADRILTVLSDKLGRITVRARGAVRKNSTLSSACQLFCCSDMVLFEKDGRYTLNPNNKKIIWGENPNSDIITADAIKCTLKVIENAKK